MVNNMNVDYEGAAAMTKSIKGYNYSLVTLGHGKAVHLSIDGAVWTRCGKGADSTLNGTDREVTCKACIRAAESLVER